MILTIFNHCGVEMHKKWARIEYHGENLCSTTDVQRLKNKEKEKERLAGIKQKMKESSYINDREFISKITECFHIIF